MTSAGAARPERHGAGGESTADQKRTSPLFVVEANGIARGNPGPGGYGVVVRAADGAVLSELSGALAATTSNVAAYTALIEGLRAAESAGAIDVVVRMPVRPIIEQMTGRWQIRNPGLRPLAARAAELVARLGRVRFEWIAGERPARVDELIAVALEAAARGGAPGGWAPRTDTPTRLVLVRHGATEHTAGGRYSGHGDVPLSEPGRAQAGAAAARIAAMPGPISAVLTSPLIRCTQTAAAICTALMSSQPSVPTPVTEPDLIETDFGAWEGLTFAEVRERWPAEHTRWAASPAVAPPGGESFRSVTTRVRRFVRAIRAAYPGQVVVAVSHVTPIKVMLKDALRAGDDFMTRMHLDAAGISIVDSWPDGGVSVRTVNETAHLGRIG